MIRTCTSCGAQIRLVRSTGPAGAMPVDVAPADVGNVLLHRGVARVLGPADAADAREQGYDLYVSHFATCPDAVAHRRRKQLHVVGDPEPTQLELL